MSKFITIYLVIYIKDLISVRAYNSTGLFEASYKLVRYLIYYYYVNDVR